MEIEAGTKEILNLLLGEGSEFRTMDADVKARLVRAFTILLEAESLEDIGAFGRFGLKHFNDFYQIRITPEKRLRFWISENALIIEFFGSTTHKGE